MNDPFLLVYFNEQLAKLFSLDAAPHAILSFGFRVLLDQAPSDMVRLYVDADHTWSLNELADSFPMQYATQTVPQRGMNPSDFIDMQHARASVSLLREVRKAMWPLRAKLQQPARKAVLDPNWRLTHESLLELYGDEVCGRTTLRHYDSGQLSARLSSWNYIVRHNAMHRGKKVQAYERIAYIMRTELGHSYASMLQRAAQPLQELCAELQEECRTKGCWDETIWNGIQTELAESGPQGRTIAEMSLVDYESTRLTRDITDWTIGIRKMLDR